MRQIRVGHCGAHIGDDARHVGIVGVGRDRDAAAAVLAQNLVRPIGLDDLDGAGAAGIQVGPQARDGRRGLAEPSHRLRGVAEGTREGQDAVVVDEDLVVRAAAEAEAEAAADAGLEFEEEFDPESILKEAASELEE